MDELTPRLPFTYEESSQESPEDIELAAIEHYESGGGRPEIRGYGGPERRSLASRLDREMPVLTGMSVRIDSPKSEADQLVNHFREFGPRSWQEGRALFGGAAKRVEVASRTSKGDPEAAVIDRYYTYAGYLLSAAEEKAVLDDLLVYQPDGPARLDIARLRADRRALDIIAMQFMQRGFLWDKRGKYWPSQRSGLFIERHKYWLGFALAAARYASDESMKTLFSFASSRSDKLLREWVGQFQQIEKNPTVNKLEQDGKIIQLSLRRLWVHKMQKLELDGAESPEADDRLANTVSFDSIVPKALQAAIAERRQREEELTRLADEEWDRAMEKKMQIPMMSVERARQELKAEDVGTYLTGEQNFEQEYQQELEDIADRANQPKPKKQPRKNQSGRKYPALRPWIRRQAGYDKKPPPDDLTLF